MILGGKMLWKLFTIFIDLGRQCPPFLASLFTLVDIYIEPTEFYSHWINGQFALHRLLCDLVKKRNSRKKPFKKGKICLSFRRSMIWVSIHEFLYLLLFDYFFWSNKGPTVIGIQAVVVSQLLYFISVLFCIFVRSEAKQINIRDRLNIILRVIKVKCVIQ